MKSTYPIVTLNSVADTYSGFAFKSKELTHDSEMIPVIKIANIQNRRVSPKCLDYFPHGLFDERLRRYVLNENDILIAMTGAGSVGRIGKMHWMNRQYLVNQRVGIIRCRNTFNAEFLYQLVSNNYYEAVVHGLAHGAGQPNISAAQIGSLPIICPPYDIQCEIGSILSAYDDLMENNTRRAKILEQMAQMLYREWFVNFHFPGHEKVKMVASEMGQIPEGWQPRPVTQAVDVDPTTKVLRDGIKPFVPMGSLSPSSMLINDVEEREGNGGSKFRNGDTLFARITPCLENGKTGFVQFLPSDEAVAFGSTEFIVLRSRTLCPEYVYLMARSDEFRDNAIKSMSGATGRQRVQQQCFDSFCIAQPPSDILERFQSVVAPMFCFVQNLCMKNANLRSTRDLLLPKLVSGEVSVETLEEEALAETV